MRFLAIFRKLRTDDNVERLNRRPLDAGLGSYAREAERRERREAERREDERIASLEGWEFVDYASVRNERIVS